MAIVNTGTTDDYRIEVVCISLERRAAPSAFREYCNCSSQTQLSCRRPLLLLLDQPECSCFCALSIGVVVNTKTPSGVTKVMMANLCSVCV